jgi:predicted  nucleic acid-binding Zn-ribbon protein
MTLKLKDLKTLRTTLENTIQDLTTNGVNNALLITLDNLRQNNNDLIDELEGVKRLDNDDDYADDLESAKNELSDIKDNLYNLERYINRIDDKTEADLSLRSLEIAIDDLESELESAELKELSDDERDELSIDDLLAKVINDE